VVRGFNVGLDAQSPKRVTEAHHYILVPFLLVCTVPFGNKHKPLPKPHTLPTPNQEENPPTKTQTLSCQYQVLRRGSLRLISSVRFLCYVSVGSFVESTGLALYTRPFGFKEGFFNNITSTPLNEG
jgi:hypothetical protein